MFLAATAIYEDPLVLFLIGLGLLILFFWYFATEIERRKRNIGTVQLLLAKPGSRRASLGY
jgi:TM2 domain-containing membrane protein YozV